MLISSRAASGKWSTNAGALTSCDAGAIEEALAQRDVALSTVLISDVVKTERAGCEGRAEAGQDDALIEAKRHRIEAVGPSF